MIWQADQRNSGGGWGGYAERKTPHYHESKEKYLNSQIGASARYGLQESLPYSKPSSSSSVNVASRI